MGALLDKSVLRLHGISSIPPCVRDETRAHNVTIGGVIGAMAAANPASDEGPLEEPQDGMTTRQAKRQWQEATPVVAATVHQQYETAAGGREGMNIGSTARTTHGFWRTRVKKTSRGPRGARRLGVSEAHPMEAGSSESEREGDPQPARTAPEAEEQKAGVPPTGAAARNVPSATLGRVECRSGGENSRLEAEQPRRQGK